MMVRGTIHVIIAMVAATALYVRVMVNVFSVKETLNAHHVEVMGIV